MEFDVERVTFFWFGEMKSSSDLLESWPTPLSVPLLPPLLCPFAVFLRCGQHSPVNPEGDAACIEAVVEMRIPFSHGVSMMERLERNRGSTSPCAVPRLPRDNVSHTSLSRL